MRRPKGKILGVKLGYNPNSSSLGVDVTFLLLGTLAITILTPIIGLLLRQLRFFRPALPPPSMPGAFDPIDPSAARD